MIHFIEGIYVNKKHEYIFYAQFVSPSITHIHLNERYIVLADPTFTHFRFYVPPLKNEPTLAINELKKERLRVIAGHYSDCIFYEN